MATLAFGLVGAAVGSTFGTIAGLSMMSVGWTVGTYIGGMLFPPDLPHTTGPKLADLTVQTSTEGAPIPALYGTTRMAGNIIWSTGIVETAHVQETGGGKGGGGGGSHTTYTYHADFAVGICEGEVAGIRKIWADSRLIYSKPDTATAEELAVSNLVGITIYTGSETQQPDPLIQANKPDTPAYRGMCYIVFDNFQLEKYGNRIPNFTFEVVEEGTVNVGTDITLGTVTLASVIQSICLDAGIPAAQVDVTLVTGNVRGYMRTEHMTSRSLLQNLLTAFQVGVQETNHTLKFFMLDGSLDKTIDVTELGASGGGTIDPLMISRKSDYELPRRVEVVYSDSDGEYQQGNQFAQRIQR